MKNLIYLVAVLFVAACTNPRNQQDSGTIAQAESVLEEIAIVDVESLLNDPQAYDGKEVMIKGTVTHVCKHSGKRLHLMGTDEKSMLRLEAGEIGQFHRELEGSDIVAKGVFRREVIDEEYLAKWADEMGNGGKHMSHEEEEEEQGRMQRYRQMMKETEEGYLENFWVDGLSFETVEKEASI
jgi:hypothetical protein